MLVYRSLLFILALLIAPCGFSQSNFYERLGNFSRDPEICSKIMPDQDAPICNDLSKLIKNLPESRRFSPEMPIEGEGSLIEGYDIDGVLRIVEAGDTEIISDTITHYYFLAKHDLVIVNVQTPHVEELRNETDNPNVFVPPLPVVSVLYIHNGKIQKAYSSQGKKLITLNQGQIKEIIDGYRYVLSVIGKRGRGNNK